MIFSDSNLGIPQLIRSLNESEPVVMPTETVYGLAAKIDDLKALEKIFLYKRRPFFDPLIVHIYDRKQISFLSPFKSPLLDQLIDTFWPGPLTLVLPKRSQVNDLVTSGLDSVGIRLPLHPLAQELLKQIDVPLAAPSANFFGQTSPTTAAHVERDFPQLKILDGGPCDIGIESTVLKVQPTSDHIISLSILRKGVITQSAIQSALSNYTGAFIWNTHLDKKHSPGHMKHHYMPNIPIVFFEQPAPIEKYIPTILADFKKIPDKVEDVTIIKPIAPLERIEKLQFNSDPVIACRELYGKLKQSATTSAQLLVFEKQNYMQGELWEAFLERLTKASSLHYSAGL
ncbi:MAG: threonylcarbamoyl-AMP synthase [Bdellovibrionaceae bacterium]|nr:threonylcarbamoyl-AMP synthase [Pseudobdellovibrionaceae bacterium]